jgi:hypothetical protein
VHNLGLRGERIRIMMMMIYMVEIVMMMIYMVEIVMMMMRLIAEMEWL